MINLDNNLGKERRILPGKLGLVSMALLGVMAFNNLIYAQQNKKEEKKSWEEKTIEWILKPENLIPLTDYGVQNATTKNERDISRAFNKYGNIKLQQDLARQTRPEINIINQIPQQPVYQQPVQQTSPSSFRNMYMDDMNIWRAAPGYELVFKNGRPLAIKNNSSTKRIGVAPIRKASEPSRTYTKPKAKPKREPIYKYPYNLRNSGNAKILIGSVEDKVNSSGTNFDVKNQFYGDEDFKLFIKIDGIEKRSGWKYRIIDQHGNEVMKDYGMCDKGIFLHSVGGSNNEIIDNLISKRGYGKYKARLYVDNIWVKDQEFEIINKKTIW